MGTISVGRDSKRQLLYKVAPRSVPFSIGITPSDVCNFRCIYCNQSTVAGIKDARILSWEDFLFTMNQIEELIHFGGKPIKIIRLIGNGEPLLNKKLPDMVSYIRDRNISQRIEVTTNGSLLTEDVSNRLIGAGLTRLLISIQGTTKEKYKKICGYDIDYERFVDQIRYFYQNRNKCKLFIKTVDVAIDNETERKDFFDVFSPICDEINIEKIIKACEDVSYEEFAPHDIDETTRYNAPLKRKVCCDTLFMYLNIHSNGDADCCGCKYPPLYVGNIYKNRLREIWNGEIHRHIMKLHLLGKRWEIKECAECHSIEHYNSFPEDSLDEHLDEVLARLNNNGV